MRLEIESNAPTYIDHPDTDSAVSERSEKAEEALRNGIRAAQAGDRSRARTELLTAADLDPSSESAWLWLASISEYPEELLVFLNNVLDINPQNARAIEWMAATKSLLAKTFVQRGIDASESGNRAFAVQCLNQALEQDQTNAMAWLWMSYLSESVEGKLSYLEKVLEIEPENETARAEYDAAKHQVNQALLAEARSAAVEGRKSEAIELVDAFIAENPISTDGWILRSHLADSFVEKIAAFEKVLSFDSGNTVARSGLDSLRSIMDAAAAASPAQLAQVERSEPDGMENTAYAIEVERRLETEPAQEKGRTEELVFPEAALSMEPSLPEVAENEVVYFDPAEELNEQVFVDQPREAEASTEENTSSGVVFDSDAPQSEPAPNWGMDTIAFTFAFPGGDAPVNEPAFSADDVPTNDERVSDVPIAEDTPAELPLENDSFEFTVSPEMVLEHETALDDELIERTEFEPASIQTDEFEFPPVAPPFDEVADYKYEPVVLAESPMNESLDASPETYEVAEQYDFPVMPPVDNTFEEASEPRSESVTDRSIPMPDELPAEPLFVEKTGFETRIVRSDSPVSVVPALTKCMFCSSDNPPHAFSCGVCLATLSLSDLEMLLANSHADKALVRPAVERLEADRNSRQLSESELTILGIGYMNLKDLDRGYECLYEASRANPNNVVLSSQVNALLIRLEDIKQMEQTRETMPKEKKILVVDDSATVRKLIAGKLEKSGHEVFCAADGVDAIEQLEALVPDLILLDITMPRMDGYQVCKAIRSKDATKDVPVVMISGKDGFFDKVRGRMAGSTGYITKPFGPETLMKAVETYLKGEEI